MDEFQKYFFQTTFHQHFQGRNATISPIFHFDPVNNGRICHILCDKKVAKWGEGKTDNVIYGQYLDRQILHLNNYMSQVIISQNRKNKCALFLSNFIWSCTHIYLIFNKEYRRHSIILLRQPLIIPMICVYLIPIFTHS